MKVRNILLGITVMFAAAASMAAESYKEAWTKGLKEYKARKYKESAVTMAEAAKLAKTPGEKYNSMCYQGYSLKNLRKYPEAVKVFENLMKVEKLSAAQKNGAFSNYLHNIYWSKNYKKLFAVVEKNMADEKASKSIKTTCAYLACLSSNNLRKYDDKIKWAKKLQELNPKGVWYNRGFIYQAQALRGQRKYDDAIKFLSDENVAKMHPHRQGEAYIERGHIKSAMKKYGESALDFVAVCELPKAARYHKEIATVYAIEKFNAAGKLEEADVWIEKVDTIKNIYWKTRGLMRAAQALQRKGKLKEAKAKWEECKKSGPWWKKIADKEIAKINKKLEAK